MNTILKYFLLFIFFFSLSLPASYLGVFFVKQKMFEHEVEASKAWLDTEIPDAERRLQQSYDEIDKSHDLDVNSGGQMREFGEQKLWFAYSYYIWEYEKFVTILPQKNPLSIGLDYYGTRGLQTCLSLISMGSFISSGDHFMFDSKNDYMNRLQGYVKIWKAESGNTSKEWWDDFEESEFYEEFLRNVFSEMERKYELTIDEAHEKTMNGSVVSSDRLREYFLQNYVVSFYKRIAETAYQRYKKDKERGDFYSASFDSEMVFDTWLNFQSLEKSFPDYGHILTIMRNQRITDIYLDLILIIDFAIILALILLILWERKYAK